MQNEAPTGIAYNSQYQSVAAFVFADQISFCLCAFYNTYNTLFDNKGRYYYYLLKWINSQSSNKLNFLRESVIWYYINIRSSIPCLHLISYLNFHLLGPTLATQVWPTHKEKVLN